ncbi:MAG: hypothetical protein WD467_00305 [Candidatus Saccharimonadales bacterium]
MKSPVLAAIVNFVLPGSAYILLKQRVLFGGLILTSELIYLLAPLPPAVAEALDQSLDNFQLGDWSLAITAWLIYATAFAIDAYRLAETNLSS